MPNPKTADLGDYRIPKNDDPFLQANAGRMLRLLIAVGGYPLGCPMQDELMQEIWHLTGDAFKAGIDTIGVSEDVT